jgi:hypothetical protein
LLDVLYDLTMLLLVLTGQVAEAVVEASVIVADAVVAGGVVVALVTVEAAVVAVADVVEVPTVVALETLLGRSRPSRGRRCRTSGLVDCLVAGALDGYLSFYWVLTYSCLFPSGLCGLSALNFYSRKGAVGFENTSSEVRNLWALTSVDCRLLWALTHDLTVGLNKTTKSRRTFLCSLSILKGIELHVGF